MPNKRPVCKAMQYCDQMVCHACGLAWDVNDPEPPACRHGKAKVLVEISVATLRFPEQLPHDVAAEMVKTYQANGAHVKGMQAAYRLLLDRVSLD